MMLVCEHSIKLKGIFFELRVGKRKSAGVENGDGFFGVGLMNLSFVEGSATGENFEGIKGGHVNEYNFNS